jgi:hypothetical protein
MRRYLLLIILLATTVVFITWAAIELSGPERRTPRQDARPRATAEPAVYSPPAGELLTVQDLQDITGEAFAPLEIGADLDFMKQLTFQGPEELTLSLSVVLGSGAQERYDTILQFPDCEEVPQLGAEAVWAPSVHTLAVHTPDAAVEIHFEDRALSRDVLPFPDQHREAACEIARLVLSRLDPS